MSIFSGSARTGRAARLGLTALVLTALFSGSTPTRAQSGDTLGDYGDAPDTTNHHGHAMYAYPGFTIPANYPTVYDPNSPGPQGPWHRNPGIRSWLGTTGVNKEGNADQGPDPDGATNIVPAPDHHGLADQDRREAHTLATGEVDLPQCGSTSFSYIVTGAPAAPGHYDYVNVWFDWNRDGDWEDTFECEDGFPVFEWTVQNQVVSVAPGANTIFTPAFFSLHAGEPEHLWMRISVAEAQAPQSSNDGSGIPGGYNTGEVTDILLMPSPVTASKQTTDSGNGGGTYQPEVAFYHNY
jgi:hypothetical protein